MTAAEEVAGILEAAGVEPALAFRLAEYAAFVLEQNRTTNLTAARTPAAFAEHLLDALTLADDVRSPLIDIGAGAGLPGIPLALATGAQTTLVEASRKKAAFLAAAVGALGIHGSVCPVRAEELARDDAYRERFRTATARAVGSAPTVAELTLPFLEQGGVALLQRGALSEAERTALGDAALMLGGEVAGERAVDGDRRIVLVLKRSPTPARFPRRNGVPDKRPLCVP